MLGAYGCGGGTAGSNWMGCRRGLEQLVALMGWVGVESVRILGQEEKLGPGVLEIRNSGIDP